MEGLKNLLKSKPEVSTVYFNEEGEYLLFKRPGFETEMSREDVLGLDSEGAVSGVPGPAEKEAFEAEKAEFEQAKIQFDAEKEAFEAEKAGVDLLKADLESKSQEVETLKSQIADLEVAKTKITKGDK